MIRIASLRYGAHSRNLGDTVQTLAAEQFLPPVDKRLDRDALDEVQEKEPHLLIMNGWFTPRPEHWPPADAIVPIFFGFHIADFRPAIQERLLGAASIAYLRKHQPIGCRDRHTAEMLAAKGVETYHSRCLTLTFPRREREPAEGKVYLVDADPDWIPMPEELVRGAVRVTHALPEVYPDEVRHQMARDVLAQYRDQARLVITTRLHSLLSGYKRLKTS